MVFIMDTYQVSTVDKPGRTSSPDRRFIVGGKKKARQRRNSSLDRTNPKGYSQRTLRHSKSMTNLFHKSPSKRNEPKVELSTEESAPGVLKIFGDLIQSGTRYKSVLATLSSTAEELVRDALERYNIAPSFAWQYMLCDVIGYVKSEYEDATGGQVWIEACARMIDDKEKPLTLQAFWKPADTYSRRFELRKKAARELVVGRRSLASADTAVRTLPIGRQTRSVSETIPRFRSASDVSNFYSRQSSVTTDPGLTSPIGPAARILADGIGQYPGYGSDDLSGPPTSIKVDPPPGDPLQTANTVPQITSYAPRVAKIISLQSHASSSQAGHLCVPDGRPYLMTIQGYDHTTDPVVYVLYGVELKIGSTKKCSEENFLCLSAPDVLSEHCLIRQSGSERTKHDHADIDLHTIQPLQGACVQVNGRPVTHDTILHGGDFISLGDHYILIYKQKSSASKTTSRDTTTGQLARLRLLTSSVVSTNQKQASESVIIDNKTATTPDPYSKKVQESAEVLAWRRQCNDLYENDHCRLKLPFMKNTLVDIVQRVVDYADDTRELFPLSSCYLFCMLVEYSAVKYDQLFTRHVVRYITQTARAALWNMTDPRQIRNGRAAGDIPKRWNLSCSNRSRNVNTAIDALLHELQPVVCWLSNNLELLNFFQRSLGSYLLDAAISLAPDVPQTVATTECDALSVLEEAVMYGFQQTVYYLTKTLYTTLPAIVESNPFVEEDNLSMCSSSCDYENPTVDTVLSLYQGTLAMLRSQHLHPQIISQVFTYLFFFTSTSVFNSLMNKDAAVRYFKWSRGAQLRGNLDAVEAWAAGNDLQNEATTHLRKINCLADLLATPKVQLLQSGWRTLRRDYAALTPTQLHHVLCGYQLGPGNQKPQSWLPTPEDVHLLDTGKLLESYNEHPPVNLPRESDAVDLSREVRNSAFHDILLDLRRENDEGDDDGDSGLSVSQHYSSANDATLDTDCYSECAIDVPSDLLANAEGSPDARRGSDVQNPGDSSSTYLTANRTSSMQSPTDRQPTNGISHNSHIGPNSFLPGSYQKDDAARVLQSEHAVVQRRHSHVADEEVLGSTSLEKTPKKVNPICTPRRRKKAAAIEREHSLTFSVEEYNLYKDHTYVNVAVIEEAGDKQAGDANTDVMDAGTGGWSRESAQQPEPRSDTLPHRPPRRSRAGKLSQKQKSISAPPRKNEKSYECTSHGESKLGSTDISVTARTHIQPRSEEVKLTDDRDSWLGTFPGNRPSLAQSFIPFVMKGAMNKVASHVAGDDEDIDIGDVMDIVLTKGPNGLGLGLIDGLYTPLQSAGIYVRTLVSGQPAARDGRLALGDRILAVNDQSVLGADYQRAMNLVRQAGDTLTFTVEKSSMTTAMQITASKC